MVNGYEDIGLLHWLSRVVWAKGVGANHLMELVRLQSAMEMFRQDLVLQGLSVLDLIGKEQPPWVINVEQGKSLNKETAASLAKSGCFVIRGFLCQENIIAELSRRVLECRKRQTIFKVRFTMTIAVCKPVSMT
jgi:hypothetical protein